MKVDAEFQSASGLRPVSAFFLIAIVLALAGIWVGSTALARKESSRDWEQAEKDPPPAYTITDNGGRPLALFVQRLDLVLSPNAMWQAHTPERIANLLSGVLGRDASELAHLMMPDAKDGIVRTGLVLDATMASRIQTWIETGSPDGQSVRAPLDGMWIARGEQGSYTLHWAPFHLLSQRERARHGELYEEKPRKWARHLADGLALCAMGSDAVVPGGDEETLETQREAVWNALLPTTYCVAVRGFEASRAPALIDALLKEKVAYHQMRIERGRDRQYPAGRFPFLGTWGYVDRPVARAWSDRALQLGDGGAASATALSALADDSEELETISQRVRSAASETEYEEALAELEAFRKRAAWELAAQPLPLTGLERACDRLLADEGHWGFLESQASGYTFLRHRAVRADDARSYFLSSTAPSDPPRVVTTFDLMLQRQVGLALEDLMEKHRPALAMAIALDLASGDVLAVDSRTAYPLLGFSPLGYEFTPGSTFKVNVMACALEAGVVRPTDVFDVGQGTYNFQGRTIREAESSAKGLLTASACLANSVNAGLVQIGTRVPDAFLREHLRGLHYSEAPKVGFGGERPGYLPKLPWTHKWTHASITFGHELKVTLWQHAAGLAAIVRGGEWRPLRVLDAIEQGGERYTLPRAQPERVFQPETSATIRDMMRMGAREGTGKPVASPEKLPGLDVGTKTGTAQKVGTEVCAHHELEHQAEHWQQGTRCSRECRRTLVGKSRDHASCYTSSMCIWGHVEGSTRDVLVLVVVEESRKGKYGSAVAGPTAVRILKEALGRTRNGVPVVDALAPGFAPALGAPSETTPDQPWAEGRW